MDSIVTGARRVARAIWRNTIIKEGVILISTTTAIVLVAQLQALDALFDDGISLDEVKTWASAAASALGITAFRQLIAYTIARLAGSRL